MIQLYFSLTTAMFQVQVLSQPADAFVQLRKAKKLLTFETALLGFDSKDVIARYRLSEVDEAIPFSTTRR